MDWYLLHGVNTIAHVFLICGANFKTFLCDATKIAYGAIRGNFYFFVHFCQIGFRLVSDLLARVFGAVSNQPWIILYNVKHTGAQDSNRIIATHFC